MRITWRNFLVDFVGCYGHHCPRRVWGHCSRRIFEIRGDNNNIVLSVSKKNFIISSLSQALEGNKKHNGKENGIEGCGTGSPCISYQEKWDFIFSKNQDGVVHDAAGSRVLLLVFPSFVYCELVGVGGTNDCYRC
jgi:hypothetical protein